MEERLNQLKRQKERYEQENVSREGEISQLRIQRDEMQSRRRTIFKEESELEASLRFIHERLSKQDRSFSKTTRFRFRWEKLLFKSMPMDVRRGWEASQKLIKDHAIEGVYGMVGELLSCREPYFTPVEVVAKNHLFSIVVEKWEIAEQMIQHLVRNKAGRITSLPLDKIVARNDDLMDTFGSQAFPLMRFLQMDERAAPVLNVLFGKTLLIADMTLASEAIQDGLNCVTIEGDELRSNGSLKGGHYDPSKSKMRSIKETMKAKEERSVKENEKIQMKQSLDQLDQSITQCISQIDQLNIQSQSQQSFIQQARF